MATGNLGGAVRSGNGGAGGPTGRAPRRRRRPKRRLPPEVLSNTEVLSLLVACGDTPTGKRHRALLALADPRLSAQPIAGHLKDYLRELERRGRDQMYRYTIGKRIEMVADSAGWEDLDDCSAASVQKFLGGLATGTQPRMPKTINGFRADLSAFFNWAVGEGRIAFNPCSRFQKVTDKRGKTRRTLSVPECQNLLDRCRPQRRLVYLFLIYTGLRRAEASALRWGDLRLDGVNPRVDLPASITKSGRSESVPLVGVLAEGLIEARKDASDDKPVFRGVPKMESFRKDLKAAGIEEVDGRGRRVVLHSLRHSLATMLAASQVPMAVAQRIMRRRDIRLTAEVYTDEGMLPLAAGVRALPVFSIPAPAPAFRHRARSAQTASLKVQKESIASVPPENTQVPEFVPSMRHRGSFVGTVAPTGTC